MKITILTENVAGKGFTAEHGLSYLVDIDNTKILFDTGNSDIFLNNAELLGIDIENDVRSVVLSHGHWDHAGGLRFLRNKKLICHPGSFVKRFRKKDHTPVGVLNSYEQMMNQFEIQTSKTPLRITDNLFFLGQIPRINSFESQKTSFVLESGEDDFVDDDSALAAIVDNELVVVSGCSHSGICNICEVAKMVTGIPKIKTVIGGFHLKQNNIQTKNTIEYFKDTGVKNVLPSHCTEALALKIFLETFNSVQVKTGMVFEF